MQLLLGKRNPRVSSCSSNVFVLTACHWLNSGRSVLTHRPFREPRASHCKSAYVYSVDTILSSQYDPFAEHRPQKISDREDEYKRRRQKMIISPERHDPFADGK